MQGVCPPTFHRQATICCSVMNTFTNMRRHGNKWQVFSLHCFDVNVFALHCLIIVHEDNVKGECKVWTNRPEHSQASRHRRAFLITTVTICRAHGTSTELESGNAAAAAQSSCYSGICLKGLRKTIRKSHLGQTVARKSQRECRTTKVQGVAGIPKITSVWTRDIRKE
jgi:hypothetical protein